MRKKANNIEKDKRIRQVMEWILAGHLSSDIINTCMQTWNITERQAYKYIRESRSRFRNLTEGEQKERLAFHITARLKLFKDLVDKKNPDGASVGLSILKDIAKIEGLYINKVDLTSKGKQLPSTPVVVNNNSGLSDEQFNTLLEEARKNSVGAG
jgi:hypothetical protein